VSVKWVTPAEQIRFLISQVRNKFETIDSIERFLIIETQCSMCQPRRNCTYERGYTIVNLNFVQMMRKDEKKARQ